jgi:hypothetical protein
MAEIKSTLDLVMERTRNLKITEEDKKKLKQEELKGKIKGLIRRCLDGYARFEDEYRALLADFDRDATRKALADELIGQFDPLHGRSDENERLFAMMEAIFPSEASSMQKKIEAWKASLRPVREKRAAEIRENWKKARLSGSALIPNLEKDPEWRDYAAGKQEEFRNELKTLFS